MSLTLHTIKPALGSKHRKKVLGRGNASGHGTYSTKGQKGQRARSGGRKGLKQKGFRSMILSFPKMRGFKSRQAKVAELNLDDLNSSSLNLITPKTLFKAGLIENVGRGVKILSGGDIKRAVVVEGCKVSESAREKIVKAGGQVAKKTP